MDAALLLAALASRAGDRVDLVAGDRWVRTRVGSTNRTTLLATSSRPWRRWSRRCSRRPGRPWPPPSPTTSRRRALVVLLTSLEPSVVEASLLPTLATMTAHHRVVVASVGDPALPQMAARRSTTAEAYDAAAAERTLALRERTAATLGRLGVTVLEADPEQLPPRLADHYLLLKSQGLL